MERPEALEAGSIVMAGIKSDHVLEAIETVINNPRSSSIPEAYKVEDCSIRTANFILSTVKEYKFWNALY
jgi:UDP-N-acetylglucosamine 2-epimerase (non-hydrolysing)